MSDDPTTDDDQPVPQSDQCCDECGRPLPTTKMRLSWAALTGLSPDGLGITHCPCGERYTVAVNPATGARSWRHVDTLDPYPPHAAPWLSDCDCDECAEPSHLDEACMRATDHYSDKEDDMTDDSKAVHNALVEGEVLDLLHDGDSDRELVALVDRGGNTPVDVWVPNDVEREMSHDVTIGEPLRAEGDWVENELTVMEAASVCRPDKPAPEDPDTIDDPEAYLEERYGCEVEGVPHPASKRTHYVVSLPAVTVCLIYDEPADGWCWSMKAENYNGGCKYGETVYSVLPAAARAADDAARDLLAETAERLEGCGGGDQSTAEAGETPDTPTCDHCGAEMDPESGLGLAYSCPECWDPDDWPEKPEAGDCPSCGESYVRVSRGQEGDQKFWAAWCPYCDTDYCRRDDCDVDGCEGWPWEGRNDQPDINADLLAYLSRRYPDAYPVPPADRFDAMDVAYEVPCGLGAVRFAKPDGYLYWRRVAVDEQTGYRGDGWAAVEGLEPVCRDAEAKVCALEAEASP